MYNVDQYYTSIASLCYTDTTLIYNIEYDILYLNRLVISCFENVLCHTYLDHIFISYQIKNVTFNHGDETMSN